MSFSKQVLFGDDPEHDHLRALLAEKAGRIIDTYVHRIGTRRKNRFPGGGRWDPAWGTCLVNAATELGFSYAHINSKIAFKTALEKEAVQERAELLHKAAVERYGQLLAR